MKLFEHLSWRSVAACLVLLGGLLLDAAHAQDDASPFVITPTVVTNDGVRSLHLNFRVPARHRLYADKLAFELGGGTTQFITPAPTVIADKHSG
jgi:hypothetical protein